MFCSYTAVSDSDPRAQYVLLVKVLYQYANPDMTTPETKDRSVLAKDARTMGDCLTSTTGFMYTESVTIDGTPAADTAKIRMMSVDNGRAGRSLLVVVKVVAVVVAGGS